MKVLSVFGTRPEAIKMAPVVKALAEAPNINSRICVTAQHREMLDQVLRLFAIEPDYDLDLMRHQQTIGDITAEVLQELIPIIEHERPELLLVHGDTTTTFAAALAAYYTHTRIGHVEAGLRTSDKYAPYPEEMNRRLTGALADLHFAPTLIAANNLRMENVPDERIHITGNTVIDALLDTVEKPCELAEYGLGAIDWSRRVLLLTCHRRENWGEPMQQIFAAVKRVLEEHPDIELVFPWHKNPLVRDTALLYLGESERIHYVEPLDYLPFCHVMRRCHLALTDSGGLQEEAPALGKPVLVLREVTERPEAIDAGTAALAGVGFDSVYAAATRLLDDEAAYRQMAQAINPYGDGRAARRIVDIIGAI